MTITVSGSSGATVAQASFTSTAGQNTWHWDGKNSNGEQLADGAYTVSVMGGTAGTQPATIPFTVTGAATGVTTQNKIQQVQIGPLTLPVSEIQSVTN